MRTKKFIYNSITLALLQAVTFFIGLILPRLYITTYGSEINGLVSSIVQFVSYFNYVEAGLGTALIYALFKPLADNNVNDINGIVSLAKRSYIKASILYFFLVMCLSVIYPFIVKTESVDITTVILLVLVIGIFGSLDFYTMAKYRVLLTADQKEYVISLISIVALVINFVLTVLLIRNSVYIVYVRLVPLVSFIIRSSLLYLYIKHKYPYIVYNKPAENINLSRRWDALILQMSVSLNLSIPIVIVSIFCSLRMASVYSVYSMVFSGLIAMISIFTAGVSASFGNIVAKKEYDVLKVVHNQFEFLIFAITTFLYACTLVLINPFLQIYTNGVTDINYVNPIYSYLFIVWGILHNIRIPYTAIINAGGLYRETRKVNILQVTILLVLSVILVQYLEITGVLIALIIAALYRGIDMIIVIKRLVLKESPMRAFTRVVRMFVTVLLVSIPFLSWIKVEPTNLVRWSLWAIVTATWCALIVILSNYLFDKRTFYEVVCRIRSILAKSVQMNEKSF